VYVFCCSKLQKKQYKNSYYEKKFLCIFSESTANNGLKNVIFPQNNAQSRKLLKIASLNKAFRSCGIRIILEGKW